MKTIKFDKQFNQLILDGTKTQTRRPMKTDTSKYKKGDVVLIEGAEFCFQDFLDREEFVNGDSSDVVFKACNYFISYKSLFGKI